jgi:hypothetical protein
MKPILLLSLEEKTGCKSSAVFGIPSCPDENNKYL